MRNSGCGPWSAGNANVLPGTTDANPSALSPSPAKPCASALPPSPARSVPPMKPRRVIGPLPFISKNPDQARRLHARQSDDGKRRSGKGGRHRDACEPQQLRREAVKRQPPAECLDVDDREQTPRDQQTQRKREDGGDQRHRHRLEKLEDREPPPRDANRP